MICDEQYERRLWLINKGMGDSNTQTDGYSEVSLIFDRCLCCDKSHVNLIALKCGHNFCDECMKRLCKVQFDNVSLSDISCPICTKILSDQELTLVNKDYIPVLNQRFKNKYLKEEGVSLVICPKCKEEFAYEPGRVAGITKDITGKAIPPDALECLRKNRATCIKCQTNFCVECQKSPFHEGLTCALQRLVDEGIVCRFCGGPAVGCEAKIVSQRVCERIECRDLLKTACEHVCDCGHPCCGLKNEKDHDVGCGECPYEACSICAMSVCDMPSVRLQGCGHVCHMHCLQEKYKAAQMTGRIRVPRCGIGCRNVPLHECVKDVAQKWIAIDQQIDQITKEVMIMEDTENEETHVKEEGGDYFKDPLRFAHDFFDFYLCESCNKPFYGGHKDCGRDDDDPANANKHYKCLRCQRQIMKADCPIHGEEGMVKKCFYCCKPSLFYCWGRVYFCDECHKNPHQSSKGPFKPCDGKCPFAPHPPNGTEEVVSYCVKCEEIKNKELLK